MQEQKITTRRPATDPKLIAQHERLQLVREHVIWILNQ